MSATDPKKLGLDGTRQAIQSVQADAEAARRREEAAGGAGADYPTGVQFLGQGVQLLDQARQKDFAFAKSLLKLPTFWAPDIGERTSSER